MRFLKFTLAIFLVLILLFTTVFYNRSSVVTSLVNNYLAQHQSALTCIDFSLDANDDLMISRLCIDSPYVEVELVDTLIEWRFDPRYLEADKLVDAISAIHISMANVRAKGNIQFPENSATTGSKASELPTLIRQQLHQVSLLEMPLEFDVQSFVYQPFSDNVDKGNEFYQGTFSVTDKQLLLSLSMSKETDVFSLQLAKKEQGFNAEITTELAALKAFLQLHKTAVPADLSALLAEAKNESWSVTGHLKSQLNWHKQSFKMTNQLTDFSLQAEHDITQQGAMNVAASLAWQTSLEDETLQLDFAQKSNLEVVFAHDAVIKLLTSRAADSQLIEFMSDNVMESLNIEPMGSITIDFTKQTINSDGVDFTSKNLNKPVTLSLKNTVLSYHDNSAISADLQATDFSVSAAIKLAKLSPFSQQPVVMNIAGDIEQRSDSWQLKLAPSSAIELSQLALPANITSSDSQVTSNKVQPSIKALLSYWQGNVTLPKSNAQNNISGINEMSFDLQIDSQIKQLKLPQTLEFKTLDINSELSGSFANAIIKAEIIADKVGIASVKVSGDIGQPHIDVLAKDVLLSDLLGLKVELPVEIKLIDGMLDYHLSGQIKNTDNLMANPMELALSVKDLTGEVDGTWLQELNWQQKFIIKNGQVKSLVDDRKSENNLTIAKIETATPITNLSTKALINFEHNEVKVKVKNTSGKLLGGRFDIAEGQWPFSKGSAVNVKLTKIDLEKLLELDKNQGIVVTGRVSGMLPIEYDGKYFLIKEGSLHNVGDGLIQVYNNPAVEELKTSSTELKLAFDALENLHYHHLSSDVSMADDGYMLLVTAIKGRNPDLDNEVNLNLNLSYDLLGLLESLNITEHFESKVIKGLQR